MEKCSNAAFLVELRSIARAEQNNKSSADHYHAKRVECVRLVKGKGELQMHAK